MMKIVFMWTDISNTVDDAVHFTKEFTYYSNQMKN